MQPWRLPNRATGSDPTAITTTAKPNGDHYVLNGTKRFISHGHKKGYGVFYAKDETERVTAFLVDKSSRRVYLV